MSHDLHAPSERTPQAHTPGWARPFFTIWTGQAFSLLGSELVQFALVWWLTEETGSATVLAVATMFALLPQVSLPAMYLLCAGLFVVSMVAVMRVAALSRQA